MATGPNFNFYSTSGCKKPGKSSATQHFHQQITTNNDHPGTNTSWKKLGRRGMRCSFPTAIFGAIAPSHKQPNEDYNPKCIIHHTTNLNIDNTAYVSIKIKYTILLSNAILTMCKPIYKMHLGKIHSILFTKALTLTWNCPGPGRPVDGTPEVSTLQVLRRTVSTNGSRQ